MRKMLSMLIVAAFVLVAVPTTTAEHGGGETETKSRPYYGTMGYYQPVPLIPKNPVHPASGRGIAIMCPEFCAGPDTWVNTNPGCWAALTDENQSAEECGAEHRQHTCDEEDRHEDADYVLEDEQCEPYRDLFGADLGGARIEFEHLYLEAIVTGNDNTYGTAAALSACIYDPEGDNTCDGDDPSWNQDWDGDWDFGSDWKCGPVELIQDTVGGTTPNLKNDYVVAWAISIMVSDELKTCSSSTGFISATMSNP